MTRLFERRSRLRAWIWCRQPLREWAVIVEALGQGEQILILRKGGIAEGRGGFQAEHERFSYFHAISSTDRGGGGGFCGTFWVNDIPA